MPRVDWEIYKEDEKQAVKNHPLTATQDTQAQWFQDRFINNPFPHQIAFLDAIAFYGPVCLDVGCAYAAQFYALRAKYPNVIWRGVEVSNTYKEKADEKIDDSGHGPIASIDYVDDYKTLPYLDNSFDVVTARSFLKHYTFKNAAPIMDEMFRVCRKAVIILLISVPDPEFDLEERHTERFGVWDGTGFTVEWSSADLESWLDGKRKAGAVVKSFGHPLCIVIEKPQAQPSPEAERNP